ncbi:hypothetical protein [Actinocorallia sp. A-T 12471]|uniref:hypothetical protein n=1 Tax=Actinocorallia sp. A-T 12471 TaxID=3089813 RepID=UPI0029CF98F2|nr:hypothetical protein [Actinocorallia sp. A-T 12471]MDX6741382.1 hypothetical protein [Actinocorallia sp. A-T 12471]
MKNLIRTAVVGFAAASALALAQPASAASFGPVAVGDGTVSYNDGTDSFCAQAYNTEGARWVQVTLVPLSRSGPSPSWTDQNNYYGHSGSSCRSLASAYEDTYYRADIRTYWGERGTVVTRASRYFYS